MSARGSSDGRRIAVVGGGIGGLAAAWLLRRSGHLVVYLDAAVRPGGFLRSTRRDGFLCESGPSTLRLSGDGLFTLLAETGLDRRRLQASAAARRRFIWSAGRLCPVPTSPVGLLRSPLLDWRARLRLLAEPLVPRKDTGDHETVLEFGSRRLGAGAARALLAPAVAGVFGGDAARLAAAHAVPALVEMERRHGSLARGMMAERPRPAPLVSFPDGIESLPRALADGLDEVRVAADVTALERDRAGWRIHAAGVPATDVERVVLCSAPRRAAELLAPIAPAAAAALRRLHFAPVALVHLGFPDARLGMELNAFGFLVPPGSGVRLLACQYESSLLPGRAPRGGVLLRAILGGDTDPGVLELDDGALTSAALDGLRKCAGLRGTPCMVHIERHPGAMPQYLITHGALLDELRRAVASCPWLTLACHGLQGVGVRTAVEQAARAAMAAAA